MSVDVLGSCGLAETENTEKSRVIETAKMIDFMVQQKKRGLHEIVLGRSTNDRFYTCCILSL